MLNAIKFLVGSSQHVFPKFSIKLYYCQKRRNFKFAFRKNHLRYQKGNKKLHLTHYYSYFYFSHFCYERLKTYYKVKYYSFPNVENGVNGSI